MAALVVVVGLVSGCTSDDDETRGTVGYVEGHLGGVVADEPQAALIGRDILSAGGSAVDAAVAVYFALAVTKPSSASLGGGGVCVVHDHESTVTESLDFLARAPRTVPPGATRPSAVPGNPRGFFALYAKYGRLRWAQLVAPAENMARFGIQVSRSLARDLAAVEAALMAEPDTRRIFARPDGRGLVGEGDFLTQFDLSAVLGRLRVQRPGDFYNGQVAAQLVEAVKQAGGSLEIDDLRGYSPVWRPTIEVPFGNLKVHFAPPPSAAGAVAALMWAMLTLDDLYEDATPGERYHLLAEAGMRAFADRRLWLLDDGTSAVAAELLTGESRIEKLMAGYREDRHQPAALLDPAPSARPENPAATSFVVVDRDGSGVACALTMNNLFGTGRVAAGTGILLAAMPGKGGRGPLSLGPMLVVNPNVNQLFFAASASGGVAAPSAMINVAARTLIGEQSLAEAISAKRIHHGGDPDLAYHEQGLSEDVLGSLARRGHRIGATSALGLVNAVSCPGGIPRQPETCLARADPRGFGLAMSAD